MVKRTFFPYKPEVLGHFGQKLTVPFIRLVWTIDAPVTELVALNAFAAIKAGFLSIGAGRKRDAGSVIDNIEAPCTLTSPSSWIGQAEVDTSTVPI